MKTFNIDDPAGKVYNDILRPVFKDGVVLRHQSLADIRQRLEMVL